MDKIINDVRTNQPAPLMDFGKLYLYKLSILNLSMIDMAPSSSSDMMHHMNNYNGDTPKMEIN